MDLEKRVIRIVSGSPDAVESTVNKLREDYAPISGFCITESHGIVHVTVVLGLKSEMEKNARLMQLAGAPNPFGPRPH